MCADAGLTLEATAKALHVTPRTVRNWFSGKVGIPYAAYRLMRILGRYELPDPAWDGWVFHSGQLWSPEGHGFKPADSAWWSQLVRRARLFHQLLARDHALDAVMARAGRIRPDPSGAAGGPPGPAGDVPTGAAGRAAKPPGPNLFLEHFRTGEGQATRLSEEKCLNAAASVSTNKTGGGDA